MFRYTRAQVSRMQTALAERSASLAQQSHWPDINYIVDESWARVLPYGSDIGVGETLYLELRITNDAPTRVIYKASWNFPAGLELIRANREREIARRRTACCGPA